MVWSINANLWPQVKAVVSEFWVWAWATNCYYSQHKRWVWNGVKITKEECLVRLWSTFSSVKLHIVSMAYHSDILLRRKLKSGMTQTVRKWCQRYCTLFKVKKYVIRQKKKRKKKIGFMALETACTFWKWCVNPWWYEVITCDGLSLWEDASQFIQFPKRFR